MPARLVLTWSYADQPFAQNVFHFLGPVNQGETQYQQLADAAISAWNASDVRDQDVALGWKLQQARAENYNNSLIFSTAGPSDPGGAGADMLPKFVSIAVRLVTIGANQNGRSYVSGINEIRSGNDGRPTPGMALRCVEWVEALQSAAEGTSATWDLGVRQGDGSIALVNQIDRSPSSIAAGWQTQRRRRFPLRV
jgi:hypothetical protein